MNMELQDKVYAVMQHAKKALRTGEIAALAGLEKKDTEKAIKLLKKEGKIFSPVRCYWQVV